MSLPPASPQQAIPEDCVLELVDRTSFLAAAHIDATGWVRVPRPQPLVDERDRVVGEFDIRIDEEKEVTRGTLGAVVPCTRRPGPVGKPFQSYGRVEDHRLVWRRIHNNDFVGSKLPGGFEYPGQVNALVSGDHHANGCSGSRTESHS